MCCGSKMQCKNRVMAEIAKMLKNKLDFCIKKMNDYILAKFSTT